MTCAHRNQTNKKNIKKYSYTTPYVYLDKISEDHVFNLIKIEKNNILI